MLEAMSLKAVAPNNRVFIINIKAFSVGPNELKAWSREPNFILLSWIEVTYLL